MFLLFFLLAFFFYIKVCFFSTTQLIRVTFDKSFERFSYHTHTQRIFLFSYFFICVDNNICFEAMNRLNMKLLCWNAFEMEWIAFTHITYKLQLDNEIAVLTQKYTGKIKFSNDALSTVTKIKVIVDCVHKLADAY